MPLVEREALKCERLGLVKRAARVKPACIREIWFDPPSSTAPALELKIPFRLPSSVADKGQYIVFVAIMLIVKRIPNNPYSRTRGSLPINESAFESPNTSDNLVTYKWRLYTTIRIYLEETS